MSLMAKRNGRPALEETSLVMREPGPRHLRIGTWLAQGRGTMQDELYVRRDDVRGLRLRAFEVTRLRSGVPAWALDYLCLRMIDGVEINVCDRWHKVRQGDVIVEDADWGLQSCDRVRFDEEYAPVMAGATNHTMTVHRNS